MMSMNLRDIQTLKVLIIAVLLAEIAELNEKHQFDQKIQSITKHINLFPHIKMGNEILTFGDIPIERNKFYRHKSPIF